MDTKNTPEETCQIPHEVSTAQQLEMSSLLLGLVAGMTSMLLIISLYQFLTHKRNELNQSKLNLNESHPLLRAARQRNWLAFVKYLKKYPDLDLWHIRDNRGNTILHYAVLYSPPVQVLHDILNHHQDHPGKTSPNLAHAMNAYQELALHWSLKSRSMQNLPRLAILLKYNPASCFAKDRKMIGPIQSLEQRLLNSAKERNRMSFVRNHRRQNMTQRNGEGNEAVHIHDRNNNNDIQRRTSQIAIERQPIPFDGRILVTPTDNNITQQPADPVRSQELTQRRPRRPLLFQRKHSDFDLVWEELGLLLRAAVQVKYNLPTMASTKYLSMFDEQERTQADDDDTTKDKEYDDDEFYMLHAALATRQCPASICLFLIQKLPSQVFKRESSHQNSDCRLPLHIAASTLGRPDHENDQIIAALLEIYQDAAKERTKDGRLPLGLAVETHKSPEVIMRLYHAGDPDVVNEPDSKTSLLPFMTACCKDKPKPLKDQQQQESSSNFCHHKSNCSMAIQNHEKSMSMGSTISHSKQRRRSSFVAKRSSLDMLTNCFNLLKQNPVAFIDGMVSRKKKVSPVLAEQANIPNIENNS